jgi:hypothetical protein
MRLPEVRVYYNPKAADRGTAAAGRSPGVVCSRKPGRHPAVGWQGGLSDRFPRFPRERSVLLRTSPRHRRALAVATPAKGQLRAPQRAQDRGSGKVLCRGTRSSAAGGGWYAAAGAQRRPHRAGSLAIRMQDGTIGTKARATPMPCVDWVSLGLKSFPGCGWIESRTMACCITKTHSNRVRGC